MTRDRSMAHDRRRMIPAHRIRNPEVRELAQEASEFLASHSWCAKIRSQHLAWAIAGVIGVFHFRIVAARPGIDEELWVIVGDLPSAYLVTAKREGWQEALRAYVREMTRWVRAVRARRSVKDLIPVNTPPTREYAEMLGGRLGFIRKHFLRVPAREVPRDI